MGAGFDRPYADIYNEKTGVTTKIKPLNTPLGGLEVYDVDAKGKKLTSHMRRYPHVIDVVTDRYLKYEDIRLNPQKGGLGFIKSALDINENVDKDIDLDLVKKRMAMLNGNIEDKPQEHKDAVQAIVGPILDEMLNKDRKSSHHKAEVVER